MASDRFDDVDLASLEPEERAEHLGMVEVADEDRIGDFDGDFTPNDVTDDDILGDRTNAESWLQYNGNLGQTGYSPADRITTDNVGSLSKEYEIVTERLGLETNPIIVPGDPPEMYFTVVAGLFGGQSPKSRVQVRSVNARTGENIWTNSYEYPDDSIPQGLNWLAVNRGVTVYDDKVFVGTADTKIVAFERSSGEIAWEQSVLLPGQEQIRTGISATPLAYDGKIYTGQAGDANGWSAIIALDAQSGEELWTQRTAPEKGWVADTAEFASAAPWMSPAVDPESNTVFFQAGNPDPMLNGVVRPGPNKYSNSILAMDADSGEMKWHHQLTPHELWDYDAHTTPLVYDLEVDGETRRVVAHDYKAAWTYNIDVETGELVTRTEPFALQTGRFMKAPQPREENAQVMAPDLPGGTEWPPDAYSHNTGFRYIGATNAKAKVWYDPEWAYGPNNFTAAGGGTQSILQGTSAEIVALNPATGGTEWTFELSEVSSEWPAGLAFPGGPTATAGGLVFAPSSSGKFYALDDSTGEQLWSDDLGGRPTAGAVVWDDPTAEQQFVAIAADNKIIAYTN